MEITFLGAGIVPHLRTLTDLVALQLGEHGQNTNHGTAKRGAGVKVFQHRNKCNLIFQKDILNDIEGIFL